MSYTITSSHSGYPPEEQRFQKFCKKMYGYCNFDAYITVDNTQELHVRLPGGIINLLKRFIDEGRTKTTYKFNPDIWYNDEPGDHTDDETPQSYMPLKSRRCGKAQPQGLNGWKQGGGQIRRSAYKSGKSRR